MSDFEKKHWCCAALVLWWCMKKKSSVLCNDTDLVSDTEKVTVSDLWWCMEKVIVERLLIALGRDTKKS
jgi:hypothetical protein